MPTAADRFTEFLSRPIQIFWICVTIGTLALLADKSLYRYFSLSDSEKQLDLRLNQVAQASQLLKIQIEKANRPEFIAREARDRLDLISDDEMVFIFNESD